MNRFPLPVKAYIPDSMTLPSSILQFGDGYEQLSSNGLNAISERWDVEVAFPDVVAANILQRFLVDHGQHKLFEWQSPRDSSPSSYRILGQVSGTVRNSGGNSKIFFTRRMTFEKATDAIEPSASIQLLTISLSSTNSLEG
jgi:phage-related protein